MARIPVLLLARELNQGGVERDLTRLALGFQRGPYEPHVACFRGGGMRYDDLVRAGVPVANLRLPGFGSPAAIGGVLRLARYVRKHTIQLVHAMDVPAAAFAVPVCRFARAPAILACQLSYRGMCSPTQQRLLGYSDKLADRVVGNCQAVLDDLVERYGTPAEKTALVYNGVELDRFHPPDGGRDRTVLPEAFRSVDLVIGSVCASRPEKRLDVLIRAFALLEPKQSGVRLVCVGSGEMDAEWQGLVAALGVSDYVHFEPATPNAETWMRACDVYSLPSELESFPNGLLEAMACGCAVTASDVGGVPEMAGDAGLLFPVGDHEALASALRELYENPERRAELGRAAARRAALKFSLAHNLRATARLYAETLAQKDLASPSPEALAEAFG